MNMEKPDLYGGIKKYSKVDLEDVDSWLPPDTALFLAKTIAARGWSQLSEAVSSNSGDTAEWQEMPKVARDYHGLLEMELLEVSGVELGGEVPPEVSDESGGAGGESVPFYY